MRRKGSGFNVFCVLLLWVFAVAPAAFGQGGDFEIDYTVRVASTRDQLFHVVADIKNNREDHLLLSLPTWTPGWYTIENYAKNILRFQVTDAKGAPLPHTMTRKQTWSVETGGRDRIRVEFDYHADVLALNQAKIARDYAFFTGTELFLMAEGHRNAPSIVRLVVPPGWKIISALKETADETILSAPDYDTLVDAPTEMGKFDVTRFEVEGKPHYFVSTPAGAYPQASSQKFTQMLARVARAEGAIFGGLPYDKYVYFYFFTPPESNASGALEHSNSHVSFTPPLNLATPERMIGTAAHEFFHLWNVKRIRPAEMWPYDYSREDETPLLWVSEGFTNYYGALAVYRAGLHNQKEFIDSVQEAINGVESNEARAYISPAEASVSTWLGYDTPVAFGISYYTQGQNLGALLDLSIRHDTSGTASLDDCMRSLYRDFYQSGKGFSTEDMIGIINRLTGRDYHDFYRRYVWGVEVPPYETILGYAGYRVEKVSSKVPLLGIDVRRARGGLRITRISLSSPAAEAGLAVGDVIVKVDGIDIYRTQLSEKMGQTVKLLVRHGGQEKQVTTKIGSREESSYRIAESPQPTREQLKVREGWLRTGQESQTAH